MDIKPGLIYKGADNTEIVSCSCILVMLVCNFAPLPLCIDGNSCSNGSAACKWTMSSHTCCWLHLLEVTKINVCFIVLQRESEFFCNGILCYFVVKILKWCLHIYNSLVAVMTLPHSWMCMCILFVFYMKVVGNCIYISIKPCWYFTVLKASWGSCLLMLTT